MNTPILLTLALSLILALPAAQAAGHMSEEKMKSGGEMMAPDDKEAAPMMEKEMEQQQMQEKEMMEKQMKEKEMEGSDQPPTKRWGY
ncbi:MAG: hypothetical protein AB1344_06675 [Pseudomonadota bacterium]